MDEQEIFTRGDTPTWRHSFVTPAQAEYPLRDIVVFYTMKDPADVVDSAAADLDDESNKVQHWIAFDADGVVTSKHGFELGVFNNDTGEFEGTFSSGVVTHIMLQEDSNALDAGEYVFDVAVMLRPTSPHRRSYTFMRAMTTVVEPDVTRRSDVPE